MRIPWGSEVLTQYLEAYGPDPVDALFPVLKTPYGIVGGMMCSEAQRERYPLETSLS